MADVEHLQMIASTITEYAKGASDETIRERILLALMQRYGKITYDHAGKDCAWQVEYSQPNLHQAGDGTEYVFDEHVADKQLTLPWRGYYMSDRLTEKQRLMNRGAQALINLYAEKGPRLLKAIKNKFGGELYKDGNSTGRENAIHGFESCLAEGTTVAADKVAKPNDSYAGLSTALGAYGGAWSANLGTSPNASAATDWPFGNSSTPEYDFISPKMFNASSTNYPGGASPNNKWSVNCEYVLRDAVLTVRNTTGGKDPLLVVMGVDWYSQLENVLAARFRTTTPTKESDDLGFGGTTLQFEGATIHTDFDCPAGTAYGIKVGTPELACLYGQLFNAEGPEKDFVSNSYLFRVGFFGNLKLKPRHMLKIKEYA